MPRAPKITGCSIKCRGGCGKVLKRDIVCKKCSKKPWHEVDETLEKYALVWFKKRERLVRYLKLNNEFPRMLNGERYFDDDEDASVYSQEEIEHYISSLPKSFMDVDFETAKNEKTYLDMHRENKKRWKQDRNKWRWEDNGPSCPKNECIKRICRVCKTKKPLDINFFYWKTCVGKGIVFDELNENEKKLYIGHVCRDCFEKQKEAIKALSKIGVKIGVIGSSNRKYARTHQRILLAMGRTLVESKNLKKELQK